MIRRHEDFQKLFAAINLVLSETQKPRYLPEWLYNFWQSEDNAVSDLKDKLKQLELELQTGLDLDSLQDKLIKLLDKERYFAAVHLKDQKLLERLQDALLTALFFSQKDIQKYDEFVIAEQEPEKFINYLNHSDDLTVYKQYLKKQHAVYGRFIKNFTEDELNTAAKAQMINGKLLDYFELEPFLTYGFHYVKQELKALIMNKIEKGFLNQERMDSYLEKISFILHPANELQQDKREWVKHARYILEDIINAAGVKEHAVPNYPEHDAIINSCYWVDEMFKTAAGKVELLYLS